MLTVSRKELLSKLEPAARVAALDGQLAARRRAADLLEGSYVAGQPRCGLNHPDARVFQDGSWQRPTGPIGQQDPFELAVGLALQRRVGAQQVVCTVRRREN